LMAMASAVNPSVLITVEFGTESFHRL